MHEIVQTTLKELLDAAGFPHSGITRADIAGQVVFAIQTEDAGALIGTHGDTVHALDHLVKKIVEKQFDSAHRKTPQTTGDDGLPATSEVEWHFLVDVNDYRAKQIKNLQNKALMMAERARSFQYDVELSPMTAYERLIVHTTLQDSPNVKTESQGEGRSRRVVIKYSAN